MPYVWILPRGRSSLGVLLFGGFARSGSRRWEKVLGPFFTLGAPNGQAAEKRGETWQCGILSYNVKLTMYDWTPQRALHQPGHEGTAAFSTDQGKVAHPVSQFRMRFRYSYCYRFTTVQVQWSEDPSMGEISLMIWWSFHQTKGVWFPRRVLGSPGEQPQTPWTLFRESAVGGIDLCVTPHRLRALVFQ